MSPDVLPAVAETLMSGFIGQGPRVEEFENRLADYISYPYLVTLNSATSAIYLALQMAGVTHDSQVISSPLTCSATTLPILARGGKVVWADVDPSSCNVDINNVVDLVSTETKAILVVAWGGYPVRIDELQDKVKDKLGYCPVIIEDCAHAFGSLYKGKWLGATGDYIAAYSFQAIKQFTTVDGGMLVVPQAYYKRAKLLRWYGIDREEKGRDDFRCEQNIQEPGFKFHMNDVNAAIGIHQLPHTAGIVAKHRENAAFYRTQLDNFPGIELLKEGADSLSAYWLFTFKVERRKDFVRVLGEHGIAASKVHERNDIHDCFAPFKRELPQLESINDKIVSIPVGWWVEREDREFIADTIKRGW